MKKIFMGLMGLLLVFSLAACNKSATDSTDEETKKKDKPKITAQEVYDKMIEADKELSSFSVKMLADISMEAETEGDANAFKISTEIEMDTILKPRAVYQKMTTEMGPHSYTNENYITNDGMYMYQHEEDQWFKFPDEMSNEMNFMENAESAVTEFEQLKDFMEEASLKEEEKYYVLTLNGDSGEKFTDLIKQTIEQTMSNGIFGDDDADDLITEIMKNIKMKRLHYEIYVDKETYLPGKFTVDMEMEITDAGETITFIQTVKGEYSNYNEVKEIVIPEEAKESSLSFDDLF